MECSLAGPAILRHVNENFITGRRTERELVGRLAPPQEIERSLQGVELQRHYRFLFAAAMASSNSSTVSATYSCGAADSVTSVLAFGREPERITSMAAMAQGFT